MYAGLPGWHSRHRWTAAVDAWTATTAGRQACAHHRAATATVNRVATALAAYADTDTGRRCAPAQATLATELGCSVKTIERAEHALTAAGLLTVVHGGGNYTRPMRRQYRRMRRAGHQLVKPAHCPRLRALTMPRSQAQAVGNVVPPTAGRCSTSLPGRRPIFSDAYGRRRAAPRPTKAATNRWRWRPQQSRPIELQRLAAALVDRWPWLARHRHVGAVCDALSWASITPARWGTTPTAAAAALVTELEHRCHVPTGNSCRNPLGWLHHALQAIDPDQPTPAEQRHAAQQARAEQQRQDRAANANRKANTVPLAESTAADQIRAALTGRPASRHGRDLPVIPEPN